MELAAGDGWRPALDALPDWGGIWFVQAGASGGGGCGPPTSRQNAAMTSVSQSSVYGWRVS